MIQQGLLLEEDDFCVRAITLDHGTPVLAFAYEPAQQINVSKERLVEQQLEPGSWLEELKKRLSAGEHAASITLPDGKTENVARLARELTQITQGEKLVYATDFADTSDNRQKIQALAKNAYMFFCEATFMQQESEQAARTGHLTTKACGEIANEAKVQHLIPFHFSRRYGRATLEIYREIGAICPQVVMPKPGLTG